jgi:hypothetical protein
MGSRFTDANPRVALSLVSFDPATLGERIPGFSGVSATRNSDTYQEWYMKREEYYAPL